ncbi:hypothetical protein [Streptomyces fragilis]|uniref:hypothetical protein n=1 Tax=Streptomyces fragilis TaxID=67301 RepID=UPI0024DEAC53|nr:hypothetical protein [Streptomyces fragilis]
MCIRDSHGRRRAPRRGVRNGFVDVCGHPEVAQRRRALHLGSPTGPLSLSLIHI